MVRKVQTSWAAARTLLNTKLGTYTGGPRTLSRAAGVDYHAARRLLKGMAHNRTDCAVRVCQFFGIEVQEVQTSSTDAARTLEELATLVKDVWDGTEAHAVLLKKLIDSTREFKVLERS